MNDLDRRAHPWPADGRWFDLRWRRAVWTLIRPWYGYSNKFIPVTAVERMTPVVGWLPFFTYNIKIGGYGIHGYIGWKPITLDDPAFWWRDLDIVKRWRAEGLLFVQLSWRGGIGAIS